MGSEKQQMTHTPEEYERLADEYDHAPHMADYFGEDFEKILSALRIASRAITAHLEAETKDWQQAASVEAGLRREFLARAEKAEAETKMLREALEGVVADVLEYERVNNLSPAPGRKYCWDSVARARTALANAENGEKG